MSHPVIRPGAVAVVTGGAAGIGLAAACRLAREVVAEFSAYVAEQANARSDATRADIDARVAEAARMLEIDQYLDRKPRALSGGRSRSRPMPTASSSVRVTISSLSMFGGSAASRPSMILGTMCLYWRRNPVR